MPGFRWHDAELPDQVVITYPWTPTGLRGNAFGGKSPALTRGEAVHQVDDRGRIGDVRQLRSDPGLRPRVHSVWPNALKPGRSRRGSTTVAVSPEFGDDGIQLLGGVRRFAQQGPDHNFSEAGYRIR